MTSALSNQFGMTSCTQLQIRGHLTSFCRVPENVRFEVDDVESEWLHNELFDFIFCRYMVACITDWPRLMSNAYK